MAGGRGRKDPVELRLLKNDKAHAHRYKDDNPPKPSSKKAVAPDYLTERGKELFNELVRRVEEMYPCSDTDTYALVLYAQNHEQLEYLDNFLRTNGVSYTTEDKFGNIQHKKFPEVELHSQCKQFELRILSEFGLTPSARAKVNIPKKPEAKKNSFADLDEYGT